VKRGIVVDDFLRTSDRAIFAVGECVEHRGKCRPGRAALRAGSLAHAIHGDESKTYRGRWSTELKSPA
jgi:nitrite reductase (NADH) large subunit